jgi:hypothetical protein
MPDAKYRLIEPARLKLVLIIGGQREENMKKNRKIDEKTGEKTGENTNRANQNRSPEV